MPWYLNLIGVFVLVFGTVYVLSRIFSRLARRTIANWSGFGVVTDLTPAEAGVLLAVQPERIVAVEAAWLELRGKVRLVDEVPPRVEWIGGPPVGEVETAFRGALSRDGRFTDEGSVALLEAVYRSVNEKLLTGSGRATAVRYRDFVSSLWEEDLPENVEEEGLHVFMILADPGRDWERLGTGPDSERVKRAYRFAGHLRDDLFSDDFLVDRVRNARDGFFRYRRDLIPVRPAAYDESELVLYNPYLDSGNDSDTGEG